MSRLHSHKYRYKYAYDNLLFIIFIILYVNNGSTLPVNVFIVCNKMFDDSPIVIAVVSQLKKSFKKKKPNYNIENSLPYGPK